MNNAKIIKRISAYLLDVLLVYVLISLIGSIRFLNPTYDKYVESYEQYNEVLEKYYNEEIDEKEFIKLNSGNLYNISKYSISTSIISIIVIVGYFVFFQKFAGGQTLGKKIMKIKTVSANSKEVSIVRYLLRLIPVYYLFIGNVFGVFLNIILVLTLNGSNFMNTNSIVIYSFLVLGIISFVMMCVSQEKIGLHDRIAKTKVVME